MASVNGVMVCMMTGWCVAAGSAPSPADVPSGARCLLRAYPKHLCGASATELVWCDGTRMPYDDGRRKRGHEEVLRTADLEEQMSQPYPLGTDFPIPGVNIEPGRIRHEPFFRKMYGDSAGEVRATLESVRWMPSMGGKTLRVTGVNEVAARLQRVSDDLEALPASIKRFVAETSGTFVWRTIGGTTRLSMHSFAIALDAGVKFSDFWGWVKPEADGTYTYRNRMPLEVVEIFERHGFIWGGKWYHFDTMHFEYRPELLDPECAVRHDPKPRTEEATP